MKIAMVGSRGIANIYGGIERSLAEICPRLASRGHEVVVFSLSEDKRTSFYKGVKIIPVKGIGGKHAQTLTRSALSTVKCLARGFDIVNFHAEGPGIFSFLTRLCSVKSVVTVHGLDWNRSKWSSVAKLSLKTAERVAVKFADRIAVVSMNLEKYFAAKYEMKAHYIPNGLSRTRDSIGAEQINKLGLTPEGYVFFANRLEPGKGCQDLIRAFNGIDTDKKLVIAGEGHPQTSFDQTLRKLADPRKVIFTGHVTGSLLDELYGNSYLFILPSYSEGLSNALLEAIGNKKYALVSNIPGNLEVVGNDEFSFKVGCIPDLRSKLTSLLNNEKKVLQGGKWLFEEAQNKYNWDNVADQYENLYSSLLN